MYKILIADDERKLRETMKDYLVSKGFQIILASDGEEALKTAFAQAIMENPDLMILDEPFNGLDKKGVREIRSLIMDLKKEGKTILLTSHNSEDICVLADVVWEMDGGYLNKI